MAQKSQFYQLISVISSEASNSKMSKHEASVVVCQGVLISVISACLAMYWLLYK